MTATAAETTEERKAPAVGRIARVIGPVVDIEFPPDELPAIYNALKTTLNLAGADQRQDDLFMNESIFSRGKSALKGLKVCTWPPAA